MIKLQVNKSNILIVRREKIASGTVNRCDIQFTFSSEWDDLVKMMVAKADEDGQVVSTMVDESTLVCTVPWEVLADPYKQLYIGFYGTKNEEVVLPTIWINLGEIELGARDDGIEPTPATTGIAEQMLALVGEARDIVDESSAQIAEANQAAQNSQAASEEARDAAVDASEEVTRAGQIVDGIRETADELLQAKTEAAASATAAAESARAAQDALNGMNYVSLTINQDGYLVVNNSERLGSSQFSIDENGNLTVNI